MTENLFEFEEKYQFLYQNITANGFPVYLCLRKIVQARLRGTTEERTDVQPVKGRVYPRRILDGMRKQRAFAKKKTMIFTSSVYRRDKGRNLAAEYLMERYPDAVVFEWPSRNDTFDAAYFTDEKRDKYCPLDFYVAYHKLYAKLYRREKERLTTGCRGELERLFSAAPAPSSENETNAIKYIMGALPEAYAETVLSQHIFKKFFAHYRAEYAIDFWGAARESIFPVLQGAPRTIELQHGIITDEHDGYIYPAFVKKLNTPFFKRKLLIYGEATKKLLVEKSIFLPEQIEVIGNPRIKMYKKLFAEKMVERDLVLFTSQPYEQDGQGNHYYDSVIPVLKEVTRFMEKDSRWTGKRLAIKLHPRENDGVREIYQAALPGVEVFGSASQLFELLSRSYFQLTVTSTSLYEAAEFDTPTVAMAYAGVDHKEIYGFDVWCIESEAEVADMMNRCLKQEQRGPYLDYLREMTKQYM